MAEQMERVGGGHLHCRPVDQGDQDLQDAAGGTQQSAPPVGSGFQLLHERPCQEDAHAAPQTCLQIT